ncbi:hypothetical protein GCM10009527_096390 [Actinomadura nitritigenes]
MRFGHQIDAQVVLADSRRCIGYLPKGVAECHEAETPAQRQHIDRMAEALRYEPCPPTCANPQVDVRSVRDGQGEDRDGEGIATDELRGGRRGGRCAGAGGLMAR